MAETFDEQLRRFDLMCDGDSTWDLSENDIAALCAVRTELRIISQENARLKAPVSDEEWLEAVNNKSWFLPRWDFVIAFIANRSKPQKEGE